MRSSIFVLFVINLFFFSHSHAAPEDSLLVQLDSVILKRGEYVKQKHKRIGQIRNIDITSLNEKDALRLKFSVVDNLFEEYKSFIYDSAFHYGRDMLQAAYDLKDDSLIHLAKVKISFTLLSAGMFKEALDTLNTIDVNKLKQASRVDYYSILARTYYDLANYSNDGYFSAQYDKKGNEYLQSAIELCEVNSIPYLLNKGLWFMRHQDTTEAINTFEKVLKDPKLNMHEMAIAASSVSYMYQISYNREKAKEYLIKAAIADISSNVRETVAIRDLAEILYREGKAEDNKDKIERSYQYIKVALDDAYFYGAKHRKIQIANILPLIEETHLNLMKGEGDDHMKFYAAGGVMLFIIILLLLVIFRIKSRNKVTVAS